MKHNKHRLLCGILAACASVTLLFAALFVAACTGKGAEEHTLTFVVDGGSVVDPITAKAGEAITPPQDPTKEGNEFGGWYLDEALSGEKQTLPTTMPDEDVTFYAKWVPLPKITFDTGGGTLPGGNVSYLKAGQDLYDFVQDKIPVKEGYEFGAWASGVHELTPGTLMPETDVTLSAKWKSAYTVKFYKLDFKEYDSYVEDTAISVKRYAYPDTEVTAEGLVPEHFTLNEERTAPVTVAEDGSSVLSVYVDPIYTAATDVFDSTDYLFLLESEPDRVYLDRVEIGRKVSKTYSPETGAFSFEADGFTLSGVLSGEKFYYFRDTVAHTYSAFDGSADQLEIKSANEVIFTPHGGTAITGSYDIDVETGRYRFKSASKTFEFVLYISGNDLEFRLDDGIHGWYKYGDTLLGGGWALLYFDGFGGASYLDDEGKVITGNYTALGGGIVSIEGLGVSKVEAKSGLDPLGGHDLAGTFTNADAYRGSYTYTQGRRVHEIFLDGFGGATYSASADGEPIEGETTEHGTYSFRSEDSWLVRSYSPLLGSYQTANYTGVNFYLDITWENPSEYRVPTYVISSSTDESGNTVNTYVPYNAGEYDVSPGRHNITLKESATSFAFMGTDYAIDATHEVFLYFYATKTGSWQSVSLWWGEKKDGAFVYKMLCFGDWYSDGNEIFNYDIDYDGMYFKDMADDGSFEYDYETYDSDPVQYVFIDNKDTGEKLIIDATGVAYYTAKTGDTPKVVTYHTVATGLLTALEFTGLPEGVHNLFAVYSDQYEILGDDGDTAIYDITGKVYDIEYADGTEGGDVKIIVLENFKYTVRGQENDAEKEITAEKFGFIGLAGTDGNDNSIFEYLIAGPITAVADSTNEFDFVMDDSIWYDALDIYSDSDLILISFGEFRYKVDEAEHTFLCYDQAEWTLTCGDDTFTSDGYGHATLKRGTETLTGTYSVDYLTLTFIEDGKTEEDAILLAIGGLTDPTTFTYVTPQSAASNLFGNFYSTAIVDGTISLDTYGNPLYGDDFLYGDGAGKVFYQDVTESDGDYDVQNYYGTAEFLSNNPAYVKGAVTLAEEYQLTFGDKVLTALVLYYEVGEGGFYGFFVIKNEALLGTYTAVFDNGTEIGDLTPGDGYSERSASFVGGDDDGPFNYQNGYLARGEMDDKYYDAQPEFTAKADGSVVAYVAYDSEGYIRAQYIFDIDPKDPNKVVYRGMFYGTVAEYAPSTRYSGRYLYLDGHGKATLYDSENEVIETGSYALAPESLGLGNGVYIYTGPQGSKENCTFKPQSSVSAAATMYFYTRYSAKEDGVYVNGDWSVFHMDGFGKGAYLDAYGVVKSGEVYRVIENEDVFCIRVEASNERIYVELNEDGSFTLCEGDFLVRNHVLYAYFGADESIQIPDGVTEIAEGAFALSGASYIKHIDFNGVTKLAAKACYMMGALEEVESENILEVGESAFEGTKSLLRVSLPKATTIGARAFYGCDKIKAFVLGDIQTIGTYAFARNLALGPAPFVLDLTACAHPENIEIDLTAFLAFQGYFGIVNKTIMTVEGSKILISGGVDTLNAVLASTSFKGKTASISYHDLAGGPDAPNKTGTVEVDVTSFVQLAFDGTESYIYYDLASDTVFELKEGVATKYKKDYSYVADGTVGSYYEANGKIVLYHFDSAASKYVKDSEFDVSATSAKFGNVTAYKSGASATLEAKVTVGTEQKAVVITYNAEISTFLSISVTVDVTAVTYDGKAADSFTFSSYYGTLEFTADGHGFSGTLENGTFTIKDLGKMIVLTDKTYDIWFRLTFDVAEDGTKTLSKFEYNSYPDSSPDSFYEAYSSDYESKGDNTWQYEGYYSTYELKVTFAADGTATLTVQCLYFSVNDIGDDYTITLKVSDDKTKIVTILGFTDSYETEVYQITSQTLSSDGKTATIVTDKGTFTITISADEYNPGFELTVAEVQS